MQERIAILGATGVYGRHLQPRLAAAGHSVRALVRTPDRASLAAACGAEIVQADIFDEASLASGLAGCAVVINLATSLPGPSGRGDFASNDRLRREGTQIFVRACQASGVGRILQQSIAMVHAGGGDAWSDETTFHTLEPGTVAAAAIEAAMAMESAVERSGLDWTILRGGLFYGPGTGFDDDWFSRARAGKLRLPADGDDFVSLLHISDMARATMAAIERWPSKQTLIVADDQPARWREVLSYVCATVGTAPPSPGGISMMPSFRVSNRRAREALSWTPAYSDFRTGLVR